MIHNYCDLCKQHVKKVGKLLRKEGMLLCKFCREKLKERSNIKRLTSKSKAQRFR